MDKKIAFVNIYQGKVQRGGETFVSELSSRLNKSFRVDIISGQKSLPQRVPLIWRFFIDPQGIAIFVWTIRKIPYIFKNKFDIVIPLNGGWQSALLRIVTWIYGGKLIIVGQSGIGWDDRNNLYCFPNYFIPISTHAYNWAKRINRLVKSKYIPNGVDIKKFNKNGEKLNTKLKKPIVLCVAALVKQKRIDLIIKAVAKIKNTSLLIVGEGEEYENLKNLANNLLPKRFEITKLEHNNMPQTYRVADVFAFTPESSESFGIVYTEAMATNLAVIAINDKQRQEIIGDAGILVNDPNNTNELASAIVEALKKKWGNTPRHQSEKFSWDIIANEYKKLFLELTK